MTGTHAERILELLRQKPGLDDDEIARALGIEPRQTVNQICRRLAARGALRREPGESGKIINLVGDMVPGRAAQGDAPPLPVAPRDRKPRPLAPSPRAYSLVPADLSRAMIIIPCSGAKRVRGEIVAAGAPITGSLPDELARVLHETRSRVHERIPCDDRELLPAWQRYDGSLYRAGRSAIGTLMQAGAHIVILSGGYGAVLASEPIGMYEARLTPSWWPGRIIERVLLAYAMRHGLTSIRAVVSATGPYVRILNGVRWQEAGISDALLLTPETGPGAMLKSPASQGEALAALSSGRLTADWCSSYGLGLDVHTA